MTWYEMDKLAAHRQAEVERILRREAAYLAAIRADDERRRAAETTRARTLALPEPPETARERTLALG